MKTKLFKTAHAIKAMFRTFAEALVHAWKVIKLAQAMKRNPVVFCYLKVSGEVRKAYGTLNVNYVSKSGRENFGMFNYFDIEADGWRSAKVENLIF